MQATRATVLSGVGPERSRRIEGNCAFILSEVEG
jgi:hypothetical protein